MPKTSDLINLKATCAYSLDRFTDPKENYYNLNTMPKTSNLINLKATCFST